MSLQAPGGDAVAEMQRRLAWGHPREGSAAEGEGTGL